VTYGAERRLAVAFPLVIEERFEGDPRRLAEWLDSVIAAAAIRLEQGEARSFAHLRCLARWWDGRMIQGCSEWPIKNRLRCALHGPDGARLDAEGKPL
jgi:hypothetical protein